MCPIVQLSFEMGIFTAFQQCWKQVRGTSMGNQLSPVLCDIAVTCTEQMWRATHKIWLDNHRTSQFLFRYVDNRLGVFPKQQLYSATMKQFCSTVFYGAPVILETVADNIILGCAIDVSNRSCTYVVPDQPFQFRSIRSAGSQRLNLSGLRSRAALAAKLSHPQAAKRAALQKLFDTYVQLGFQAQTVAQALKRWM